MYLDRDYLINKLTTICKVNAVALYPLLVEPMVLWLVMVFLLAMVGGCLIFLFFCSQSDSAGDEGAFFFHLRIVAVLCQKSHT